MTRWKSILVALATTLFAAQTGMGATPAPGGKRVVEFRTFTLKPGTRAEFHRIASQLAAPMQRRANMDVVACGPSAHDENSYLVIRAWATLEDREKTEKAFYGSDEWAKGPRDGVMERIETFTTAVVHLDAATVEGLRSGC